MPIRHWSKFCWGYGGHLLVTKLTVWMQIPYVQVNVFHVPNTHQAYRDCVWFAMDCHDCLPYDLSHEICGWLPSVELQLCWYNSATVIIIAVHRIPSRIERVMDAYKKLWDDLESMTFDHPQDFMLWHDLVWLLDEMHNLPPYLLFKCSDV